MSDNNKIIDSFKSLEGQEIEVGGSTKNMMLKVFNAYPTTYFTQKDFSVKLSKRTQMINTILRGLVGKEIIVRVGSPSQYYYILNRVVKTTK